MYFSRSLSGEILRKGSNVTKVYVGTQATVTRELVESKLRTGQGNHYFTTCPCHGPLSSTIEPSHFVSHCSGVEGNNIFVMGEPLPSVGSPWSRLKVHCSSPHCRFATSPLSTLLSVRVETFLWNMLSSISGLVSLRLLLRIGKFVWHISKFLTHLRRICFSCLQRSAGKCSRQDNNYSMVIETNVYQCHWCRQS